MLNQIILVGTVKDIPILKETNNGLKYAHLNMEVTRSFKNAEGQYDVDCIQCVLWRGVAESCIELCALGSVVGVKGRLQANSYTNEEGTTYTNYEVVAEKVSFLSKNEVDE